eukprot:Pgem_evm1s13664
MSSSTKQGNNLAPNSMDMDIKKGYEKNDSFTLETIDVNNGPYDNHNLEKGQFRVQPKPNALCILAICVVMSGTLMFGADTTLFGAIQSVDSFVEKFCP